MFVSQITSLNWELVKHQLVEVPIHVMLTNGNHILKLPRGYAK
jgi:hypothetical protein